MKFPKTLGTCADMLYELRQKRLAQQKIVDDLQAQETALKDHIIANLPKSDASGVSGKVANVKIAQKDVPQVKDWDAFYKYVIKKKAFELLQRRLNDKAIAERWENKESVPGVESFKVTSVSCTKV